jgi:hypothetical protein
MDLGIEYTKPLPFRIHTPEDQCRFAVSFLKTVSDLQVRGSILKSGGGYFRDRHIVLRKAIKYGDEKGSDKNRDHRRECKQQ